MCGGHLVDHGHNGFACAAGDTEQFYNATKRIVMDEHLRKQLSVNARQSAWKFERSKILQVSVTCDAFVLCCSYIIVDNRLDHSPQFLT